jgi:ribosome biogenesis protein Nip4
MKPPDEAKLQRIADALNAWAPALLGSLLQATKTRLLVRPNGEDLDAYLATRQLADDATSIPWPDSEAGLRIGNVHGQDWYFTLAGGRLAAPFVGNRTVRLRAPGVAPFLYGRPIGRDRVDRGPPDEGPDRRVLVVDPDGAFLGLAKWRPNSPRDVLLPITDLGWYLREGG